MQEISNSSHKSFNAYIDGFNLYKGALEDRPDLKWLDLLGLCRDLMPNKILNKVYYFAAPLKNRFPGDNANERQATYLRVLEHSGVEIVLGHFRRDASWQRLTTRSRTQTFQPVLPSMIGISQIALNRSWDKASPDVPKANIWTHKEKGSDVNLASYLLRDIYKKACDSALVISGDSDLATAIRFSTEEGAYIKVVFPNRNRVPDSLKRAAKSFETLRTQELRNNQFSETYFTKSGRQIRRPASWN